MTKPILFFSQFLFQNLWSNLLRLCQAKVGRLAETVSWCPCALSLAHCPGQCGPELSMHMPWVVAQMVRILPAMWETRVQSLGWEDTLEKRMANHSIILAWRIPWKEEPGGLQSIGSQRVRHDWVTNTFTFKRKRRDQSSLSPHIHQGETTWMCIKKVHKPRWEPLWETKHCQKLLGLSSLQNCEEIHFCKDSQSMVFC